MKTVFGFVGFCLVWFVVGVASLIVAWPKTFLRISLTIACPFVWLTVQLRGTPQEKEECEIWLLVRDIWEMRDM